MRHALIIGTGGHCRVVISLLRDSKIHNEITILDQECARIGEVIMDVPVMGSIDEINLYQKKDNVDVFLAIGDNSQRRIIFEKLFNFGFKLPNLISPLASIDLNAKIGYANVICAKAFLGPEVFIGNNNLINTNSVIEHEVIIGNHNNLSPSVTVAGRCLIGDDCFIGVGATIIDGIKLSGGAIIGAGATVTSDILEIGTYVGTPAKLKKNK